MTGIAELFSLVVRSLESAGTPYMLTGSFAAALHGLPRATQDIDVVIDPDPASLDRLVRGFPSSRFYLSDVAVQEAASLRGQFNVLDGETGMKVGFIFRKDRPFSVTEFGRRMQVQVQDLSVSVTSPEDLVLAKLEWARLGESARQVEDVAALLRLHWPSLDQAYLVGWRAALDLEAEWTAALVAAFPDGEPPGENG